MEDGLRDQGTNGVFDESGKGLNPCFNGRWSASS